MNSAALPLSIAMLAFITLPNNCLLLMALVQFCAESLSKNNINATPLLFLVSLSFIIVTFTTLPYLENIRYKSLFVREKGKLDTYTVLLLGAKPPLISSGRAARSAAGDQPRLFLTLAAASSSHARAESTQRPRGRRAAERTFGGFL